MTPDDPNNPNRVLSFLDHFEELRVRLIICLVFFTITVIGGFIVAPRVIEILIRPLRLVPEASHHNILTLRMAADGSLHAPGLAKDLATTPPIQFAPDQVVIEMPGGHSPITVGQRTSNNLYFLSPIEPFMIRMEGALLVSAVATVPMLIYQLWLFMAPGLKRRERRVVRPVLLASIFLFPMGALFAYYVMRFILPFLLAFAGDVPGLQASLVASKYIGFILIMMLLFGVVFEFPLVLVLLSQIGIIDSDYLVKKRKVAIVAISIVSTFIIPSPDPFSSIAMFVPLVVLYEVSIWAIRIFEGGKSKSALVLPENSG